MEISKKTIDVYTVEGQEFLDKKQAEDYEKELQKELDYTYFTVMYAPDLTEGRGHERAMTLAVPGYIPQTTAMQYCFNHIGKPLEFAQGCSPIENWVLSVGKKFESRKDLQNFKDSNVHEGIGDYGRMVPRKITYLNDRGEPIEEGK
jgi:hypothetical protein